MSKSNKLIFSVSPMDLSGEEFKSLFGKLNAEEERALIATWASFKTDINRNGSVLFVE